MKRSFFLAAVTSILLNGCTTWTLTKRQEEKLDGNYTRMLRAILNKSWRQGRSGERGSGISVLPARYDDDDRNTKVKVRSPDGDTEYLDIVTRVLQGDTLAPYLFIICIDFVLRTSIDKIRENGFELTKKSSRRNPAATITDTDYADNIAILANTPDQAETLLHSLERAAASIGLYVNAQKTEYMCYNQTGDICTLEGTPLKLVDKFTYLGSSVESTEKDIKTRLAKAWTAINRLSFIWKSDLTDKIKRSFFQAAVTSILLYGCTTWTLT